MLTTSHAMILSHALDPDREIALGIACRLCRFDWRRPPGLREQLSTSRNKRLRAIARFADIQWTATLAGKTLKDAPFELLRGLYGYEPSEICHNPDLILVEPFAAYAPELCRALHLKQHHIATRDRWGNVLIQRARGLHARLMMELVDVLPYMPLATVAEILEVGRAKGVISNRIDSVRCRFCDANRLGDVCDSTNLRPFGRFRG